MLDFEIEKNKDSLLILCAGAKSYHDDFGLIEPLLNIGNSLVIDRIKKKFNLLKLKIYIAYNKDFILLKSLESFKGLCFINVGKTKGVIETIKVSLNYINEKNIHVLPITTIPDQIYLKENAIYFGDNEIFKENWSSLKYLKNGKVKFINKKIRSNNFEVTYPFTGRLSTNKNDLIEAIKFISEKEKKDLINLARVLFLKYNYEIVHEKWFDLGHSVTYSETKNQDISSRAFNKLIYNKEKDTISKTSENNLLLSNEKDFYSSLPNKFKRYFPHVLKNNKNKFDNLEMEYISFPNLAEIFLFRKMGPNFWNRILTSLHKIYEDFYKNSEPLDNDNLSWLYSEKLKNRTEELEKIILSSDNPNLGSIFKEEIILNHEFLIPSLNDTIEEMIIFLKSFEKNRTLFFGHGDLCFNNILVEPLSHSVKLIDPKAFRNLKNNKIGLIDPIYDLAKLNHSFSCLYDSIVNNLFILDLRENNVKFAVIKPLNFDVANFYFKETFGLKKIESKTLRLITSSLFLSMLPIHKDNKNRVIAFSIIGICLFHNIDINKFLKKL